MRAIPTEAGAVAALLIVLAGCDPTGPAPEISAVSPSSASVRGAHEVVLSGTGFVEPLQVWFGPWEAEVLGADDSEIVVWAPRGEVGPVDVVVLSGGGAVAALPDGFEFLPLDLAFVQAAPHYLPDLQDLLPADAASADFDLDGDQDVLLAAAGGRSRLLVNTGGGQFVDPGVEPVPGAAAMELRCLEASTAAVVVRDLDRDGDVDVFACNGGLEQDQLLSNLDGVRFADASEDTLPLLDGTCRRAAAVDVDGDGWDDLVLVGEDGAAFLRVLLNRGSATSLGFDLVTALEPADDVDGAAVGSIATTEGSQAAFTVDLDRAHGGSASGLVTFEFAGAGATLEAGLGLPAVDEAVEGVRLALHGDASGSSLALRVTDAEGVAYTTDLGAVDWVGWQVLDLDGPAAWVPDVEGAAFQAPGSEMTLVIEATAEAAGQIGVDDVVLVLAHGRRVLVEGFERPLHQLAWDDEVTAVVAADVDQDGDADLVLSSSSSGEGRYLRLVHNRWEGPSASASDLPLLVEAAGTDLPALPDPATRVAALDADSDGDLDLVIAAEAGQDRLLLNDGHGHFFDDSVAALPVDAADGRDLAVGDLDLDGAPDLVVANWAGVDRLYLNDGAGEFDDHSPALSLESRPTVRALVLDVDGDGDLDVLAIHGDGEPPALFISTDAGALP